MLAIRPNCECCDRDLPNGNPSARICTFECTFCVDCVEQRFEGTCPNCGGDFVLRPTRPERLLAKHPLSTRRIVGDHTPCAAAR